MQIKKKFSGGLLLLAMVVLVSGCEREIEKVSDQALQEKWSECQSTENPSPAMAFACDNYKRECERRRKKTGRYIC